MSRVEIIAKMLGVEIGEDFKVESDRNTYKLDREHGLMILSDNQYLKIAYSVNAILGWKVIKLPWKPKVNQTYYFLSVVSRKGYDGWVFTDDHSDERVIARTEIYRTEEEVIAAVKEKGWVVE